MVPKILAFIQLQPVWFGHLCNAERHWATLESVTLFSVLRRFLLIHIIRLAFWSLICIFQRSCAPIYINVYDNGGTKVSFINKRIYFLKKELVLVVRCFLNHMWMYYVWVKITDQGQPRTLFPPDSENYQGFSLWYPLQPSAWANLMQLQPWHFKLSCSTLFNNCKINYK